MSAPNSDSLPNDVVKFIKIGKREKGIQREVGREAVLVVVRG